MITCSDAETRAVAAGFVSGLKPGSAVALRGDLGAGKTAFSSGVLAALGIRRVYHIDAYRINDADDLARLGFDEWITDPEGLVLIEWPERVEALLPRGVVTVTIESVSETERKIIFE